MYKAQTMTDLNAAYIEETMNYTRQCQHMQISPTLYLSYMGMLTDIYDRNKERINGRENIND